MFPERSFPQALAHGIRQLNQFGVPEDSVLFRAFLDHPAGSFNFFNDGSRIRYFPAREATKTVLQGRHVPLIEDVVTCIELPPPVKPQDSMEGFFTSWRATAMLYGLLGVACFLVGFRFRRSRAA